MNLRVLREIKSWGRLVKFSHTVFALPFALSMLIVAASHYPVAWSQVIWILCALVSARTAAMAYNRLVDREIDSRNPRTSARELPAGIISIVSVQILLLISIATFVLSASMLGRHCLLLAPLVLALLLFYSWTKRFTSYSHLVLGLALALAPGGVWYAVTAELAVAPLPLMLAVLFWVAGFDILYACQDVEFDRASKLHSLPASYGMRTTFVVSRALHILSVLLLVWFGFLIGMQTPYFIGLAAFAMLLGSQHLLLRPDDLSRIDQAFFSRNGLASVVFFGAVLLDSLFG